MSQLGGIRLSCGGQPAGERHGFEAFIPSWRLKKARPLAILLEGCGLGML
jgi:hypothetical protein